MTSGVVASVHAQDAPASAGLRTSRTAGPRWCMWLGSITTSPMPLRPAPRAAECHPYPDALPDALAPLPCPRPPPAPRHVRPRHARLMLTGSAPARRGGPGSPFLT